MSPNPPLVTVAIPTHNRAAYLAQAVDSALRQSYPRLEVLVSDNASSDATPEVAAGRPDPRLRYVRQERNLGMVGNWNACLAEARGEYFLLLSDDDLLEPTAVERLLAAMQGRPGPAFAYCRARVVDEANRVIGEGCAAPQLETGPDLALGFFASRRALPPCALLFRTTDLRSLGGYPASPYELSADAHAWLSLVLPAGMAAFVPEPLARYRVHLGSETSGARIESWLRDHAALLALCLDRLRAQPGGEETAGRLRREARLYDARAVLELALRPLRRGGSRQAAARRLLAHLPVFAFPAGLQVLAVHLLKLALPPALAAPLKAVRRRIARVRRAA